MNSIRLCINYFVLWFKASKLRVSKYRLRKRHVLETFLKMSLYFVAQHCTFSFQFAPANAPLLQKYVHMYVFSHLTNLTVI